MSQVSLSHRGEPWPRHVICIVLSVQGTFHKFEARKLKLSTSGTRWNSKKDARRRIQMSKFRKTQKIIIFAARGAQKKTLREKVLGQNQTFFGFEATKPKLIDGIEAIQEDIAARGHIQMSKIIESGKYHGFPVKGQIPPLVSRRPSAEESASHHYENLTFL